MTTYLKFDNFQWVLEFKFWGPNLEEDTKKRIKTTLDFRELSQTLEANKQLPRIKSSLTFPHTDPSFYQNNYLERKKLHVRITDLKRN